MPSYIEWNQALIDYFTSTAPKGSRIYLSVDDDVLERIGKKFNSVPYGNSWRKDFCLAVRQELSVFGTGNEIDLTKIKDSVHQTPQCVAFLGITVLAAYDMASDTNASVDERNYYRRFREALRLTTSMSKAPRGMILKPRIEEILWNRWNNWLQAQNFVPTALQGSSANTTYIGYAISQSILREADKEKIYKLVQEQGLVNNWNIDSLISYLRNNIQNLTPHLRALLERTDDKQRLDVIKKAVQDALDEERLIQEPLVKKVISRFPQNNFGAKTLPTNNADKLFNDDLSAQIYRYEGDCFFSEYPSFYLYPKQKTGIDLIGAEISINGVSPSPTLQQSDLEGWYLPVFEHSINPMDLSQGIRYEIKRSSSNDRSSYLTLNKRNFWVLIPDPDCPESGIYASFGKAILGQQFILLCRKELIKVVECLQSERLLKFNKRCDAFERNSDWVEFQQCMILSEDWEGVDLGCEGEEIKNALQPKDIAISLVGGLRVPHLRAWLIDDVPILTVFSSLADQAEITITNLSVTGQPKSKIYVNTNTPNANVFEKDGIVQVGDYIVQVACGKFSGSKSVKLIDWKALKIREPARKEILQVSNWNINGSQIYALGSGEKYL